MIATINNRNTFSSFPPSHQATGKNMQRFSRLPVEGYFPAYTGKYILDQRYMNIEITNAAIIKYQHGSHFALSGAFATDTKNASSINRIKIPEIEFSGNLKKT